ncbi:TRAP transporter substrate-binding protein [Uliginosibacterium sp. 31-12]|uniref:TRAP transporter substrate-binding protein n=1 Tax=Uliginosibacterium sp. 31-12 TaxID=3062781 RepID=UPI0026E27D2D|nr:TRAP transporter substrate-binding protein [Uliginosibacterium sp. 31-12]MDO6388384.1 TRAP transporter substrate-binding protein [Uliginosibacterium sp. 31-12]
MKTRLTTALSAPLCALLLLSSPVMAQEKIKVKVMGQPISGGMIQKNKEQPFFEALAAKTGLPFEVEYKPLDTTGIKDTEQLRILDSGLFDIVSLRMAQISRDEPLTMGFDLVGLNPDFKTARATTKAYFDTLDKRLQARYGTKLLSVWPAGPQMLFCKKPITKLADVKGLKVRVFDQNSAKFFQKLGATPIPLSFNETHQSLSLGVVDCAITGPSASNSAGWPEVTTHVLPLGIQFAMNGYGVGMGLWKKLTPAQQAKLQAAVTELENDIWKYSEELATDAMNCNIGKDPCQFGKKFKLTNVPVTEADIDVVRDAVREVSLPTWTETCEKTAPGCTADWKKTVGPVVGIK